MRVNDLNTKTFTITLTATLVLCSTTLAQNDFPLSPKPFILTDEQGEYLFRRTIESPENPSGEPGIDDVISPGFQQYALQR